MNIFSRCFHRIFDGIPKIMRIICIVTVIIFAFFGMVLGTKGMFLFSTGIVSFFSTLLLFVFLGSFCACVTAGLWQLLVAGSKHQLDQTLRNKLENEGYGNNMAETIRNGNVAPTIQEQLQQAFVWTMCERYQDASPLLLSVNLTELNGREAAMYHTCRLLNYVMNGDYEKQTKLLEDKRASLDYAYEMKPNLSDKYVPYADDALAYYMAAGALMAHRNRADEAERYRKLAAFQISQRSEHDIVFIPQIIGLNYLYASGKMEDAHELETKLKGTVSSTVMPFGTQRNLLRWIDQARIYSSIPADRSEGLADRNYSKAAFSAPAIPMDMPEL